MSENMSEKIKTPFESIVCIKTIDMHTYLDPVRIIIAGFPKLDGNTILEQRRCLRNKFDHYRKLVFLEPRGHLDMYGALLVQPTDPDADMAVIFMDNDGYGTMCGHCVISLGRYAVDHGIIESPISPETQVNIQCPCGIVKTYVSYENGKSGRSRFISVPAFVFGTDIEVVTKQYGTVTLDISYGGNFYAIISANQVGLDLKASNLKNITNCAKDILDATREQIKITSPEHEDLAFLYGVLITDGNDAYSETPTAHICVFGDRQVDRSPCGSGITARTALQYHQGHVGLNQLRRFQNPITKAYFTAKPIKEETIVNKKCVRVEIVGQGHYCGSSTFTLESDDVLGRGTHFVS